VDESLRHDQALHGEQSGNTIATMSTRGSDERTAREIYLPTFEAAVQQAHVCAIMDSKTHQWASTCRRTATST